MPKHYVQDCEIPRQELILHRLMELNPEAIMISELEGALAGIAFLASGPVALYDRAISIRLLQKTRGMPEKDATAVIDSETSEVNPLGSPIFAEIWG